MKEFRNALFGYSKSEVNQKFKSLTDQISDYQNQIETLENSLQRKQNELEQVNSQLSKALNRVDVLEKTQEQIARMALKEASTLINKAKHNANLILSESLMYVRSLSGEMDDFKEKAASFRKAVVKMSQDILDTIDNSELFTIIDEDKKEK
ncbi:MAG: DivIVA domain-containing protein [Erysipelotrichaceae bacterium]|nr:DivIVA domain-containing protein [Erysipelotrichaceae bacterium]MDD3810059.1 DivIVA domain-containing protein [Erysipelotrichaceae bacterium]